VAPGIAGQKIKEETFERLKELRKFCEASPSGGQSCIIEVDGGVSKENAKKLGEAGADILVAATAIFEGKIKENLNMLKKTIK
jgi:ribulose-phosphate 3-epimerase